MQTMPATTPTRCQPAFSPCRPPTFAPVQQGIVLFVVMVVVLITSLLVLWASRSSFFNEIATGNEADYQRAFEAAQAMIEDAKLDIMGETTDGSACVPDPAPPKPPRCRPTAIVANIDLTANPASLYYPVSRSRQDSDGGDLVILRTAVDALPAKAIPCRNGICAPTAARPIPASFWKNSATLTLMAAQGAKYGEFTGAIAGANGNPLLTWNAADAASASAWYWVEPLDYQTSPTHAVSRRFAPLAGALVDAPGYVFRITAVARGRKPGTVVALQTIYVKQENAI